MQLKESLNGFFLQLFLLLLHAMISNKTNNIPKIIRFRRWSRRVYATFQSIGKCVNIGAVCKSITEISLKKQKGILYISKTNISIRYSNNDENNKDTPPDISLLLTERRKSVVTVSSRDNSYYVQFLLHQIETGIYCLTNSYRSFLLLKL